MIRKVNVKLILELRDKGLSRTEIAASRHISRRLVNEVCTIAQQQNLSYRDVITKSEDEVYKLIYPHKYDSFIRTSMNTSMMTFMPSLTTVKSIRSCVGSELR